MISVANLNDTKEKIIIVLKENNEPSKSMAPQVSNDSVRFTFLIPEQSRE